MRKSTKQHTLITCHRNRRIKTTTAFQRWDVIIPVYGGVKRLYRELDFERVAFWRKSKIWGGEAETREIRISLTKLHVIYCLLNSHSVPGTKNAKIKYSVWPLVKFPFVGLKPLKTYHIIQFIIPPKWETNGTGQFFTVVLK